MELLPLRESFFHPVITQEASGNITSFTRFIIFSSWEYVLEDGHEKPNKLPFGHGHAVNAPEREMTHTNYFYARPGWRLVRFDSKACRNSKTAAEEEGQAERTTVNQEEKSYCRLIPLSLF